MVDEIASTLALIVFSTLVYIYAAGFIRETLLRRMTIIRELPALGNARPDVERIKGTAVICGGSVAGLHAARVCADHFERVLIVEPEAWVTTPEGEKDITRSLNADGVKKNVRSRVMQYTSIHAYQQLLHPVWRALFPSDILDDEMRKAGVMRVPAELKTHWDGIPVVEPSRDTVPDGIYMTRPVFETTLRRLVARQDKDGRIETLCGTVSAFTSDSKRLSGVEIRLPNGETIHRDASLVVDCTGSSQVGFKLLSRTGFDLPDSLKFSYNPHVRYTTAEFKVSLTALTQILPPELRDGTPVLIGCAPRADRGEYRAFAITRSEDDHIMVMTGGWGFSEKTSSIQDIKDYLHSYKTHRPLAKWVFDLVDYLDENCSEGATYTDAAPPAMNRIAYEEAKALPENFVALGDATMRLNPVNGQGCCKALFGAVTLDAALRLPLTPQQLPPKFGSTFFKSLAQKVNPIWDGVKHNDYGFSDTTEPEKGEDIHRTGAFDRWFGKNLLNAATKDRTVAKKFWEVTHFLAPPTDYFSPSIIARIAWCGLTSPVPVIV